MITTVRVGEKDLFPNPLYGIESPTAHGFNLGLPIEKCIDIYDLRTVAFQTESGVSGTPFWFLNGAGAYFSEGGTVSIKDISARDFDPSIDKGAEQFVTLATNDESKTEKVIVLGATRFVREFQKEDKHSLFTNSFLYNKDGQPSILTIDSIKGFRERIEKDLAEGLKPTAWERHCSTVALLALAAEKTGHDSTYNGFKIPTNGNYRQFALASTFTLFYSMADQIRKDESVYIITSNGLGSFLKGLLPNSFSDFGAIDTYGISLEHDGNVKLVNDQVMICRILGSDILRTRDRIFEHVANPLLDEKSGLSKNERRILDAIGFMSNQISHYPEYTFGQLVLQINHAAQFAKESIRNGEQMESLLKQISNKVIN